MAAAAPYGRDPFSQLNRWLDAQHTAPGSIRKTCLIVEDCLANNRDNLRGFFEKSFANLLKRVFGYGDYETSWLNIVTKGRDADARALVDLLAPDGKLFAAMAQADNDRLVQYIFPTERLPAHTQELLKEPQGLGRRLLDTWPQYRGRIQSDVTGRPQVYLNVFEYFMFWTAFYVLRGGSSDGSRSNPLATSGASPSSMYGMRGIRSMGSAIVGNLIMGRPAGALQGHPYYRLLRTYLEYFLPRSVGGPTGDADGSAVSRGGAVRTSTPVTSAASRPSYGFGLPDGAAGAAAATAGWASYKPTLTAAAAGPDSRGAVLLSILVEFWLTDLGEPLPSLGADRVSGVVSASGLAGGMGGLASGGGLAGVGSPVMLGGSMAGSPLTPASVSTPPNVRMLTYQPPSEELVEGLVVLVRYIHVIESDLCDSTSGSRGGDILTAGGGSRGGSGGGGSGGGGLAGITAGRGSPVGFRNGGGMGYGDLVVLQPAQVCRTVWLPETPIKTPPPPSPRLLVPPAALAVGGSAGGAAVQGVSRKVYRQLRRAFSQWPASSPTSLTPLISLWLSILAPWCPLAAHTRKTAPLDAAGGPVNGGPTGATANGGSVGSGPGAAAGNHNHHRHLDALGSAAAAAAGMMEATAAKLHLGDGASRDRDRDLVGATSRELLSQYKYTPAWRNHVLAHLPFYFILLPQFASLSLSRLKYRPDVALRDLDRVLAVLAAAGPELLVELKAAEAAYNAFARPAVAGGRRRSEGVYGELAPWWLEQFQDFETAAAAGASLPGAVQPDISSRLLTTDTASAAYTSCLLLRNAETLGRPELVAALRQSASAVLPLKSILPAAVAEQPRGPDGQDASASGRSFPRAGRWSSIWADKVKQDSKLADPRAFWLHLYRGDPMLRPIGPSEVAWLVRPLVRASVAVNRTLGLDVPYIPGEEVDSPPEHLGKVALLWARKRGIRFNLRFLAEKQLLLWLLGIFLAVFLLGRIFSGSGQSAEGGHLTTAGGGGGGGRGTPLPHGAFIPGSGATGGGGGGGVNYHYHHGHSQWHGGGYNVYGDVHGGGGGGISLERSYPRGGGSVGAGSDGGIGSSQASSTGGGGGFIEHRGYERVLSGVYDTAGVVDTGLEDPPRDIGNDGYVFQG